MEKVMQQLGNSSYEINWYQCRNNCQGFFYNVQIKNGTKKKKKSHWNM